MLFHVMTDITGISYKFFMTPNTRSRWILSRCTDIIYFGVRFLGEPIGYYAGASLYEINDTHNVIMVQTTLVRIEL